MEKSYQTMFKIYELSSMDRVLRMLEAHPGNNDLVLRWPQDPHEGTYTTRFNMCYATMDEALAALVREAPVDSTEYVILPVYGVVYEGANCEQ